MHSERWEIRACNESLFHFIHSLNRWIFKCILSESFLVLLYEINIFFKTFKIWNQLEKYLPFCWIPVRFWAYFVHLPSPVSLQIDFAVCHLICWPNLQDRFRNARWFSNHHESTWKISKDDLMRIVFCGETELIEKLKNTTFPRCRQGLLLLLSSSWFYCLISVSFGEILVSKAWKSCWSNHKKLIVLQI